VAVNCGAIPTELMESELFGHKRGSFTGAVTDKKGLIPSAEGGTLFLDEIADLPLHMQVKLLRVIQEKTVRPIGEQQETSIDVRILSATHKNLAQLVADGKFREDLFYRVNVIELRVPSLRERREDVQELAEAILRRLARRAKMPVPSLSKQALAALENYSFPGNVRELENILERAITLNTGGEVQVGDIQLRPSPSTGVGTPAVSGGTPVTTALNSNAGLGDQLEGIEREAILKALEQARFNKTAAAKALGISFRALRYRIKKLGIE
jgi:two-component system response regulator PilR (NtrC family)